MMDKFFDALRLVADHPLALVGYVAVVAAWLVAFLQTRKANALFGVIKELPEEKRLNAIALEYRTVPKGGLTANQWLRSRRQTYKFSAFAITLIVVAFIAGSVIWLLSKTRSYGEASAPVGVAQSIQDSSGSSLQIRGDHNTIYYVFMNSGTMTTVPSGRVPPVADGTDSNLPALLPLPSDQATDGGGWELSLDGVDDYCWTECPQFATLRTFRMETCFYRKRESYGNHAVAIVSLTDTNSNLILALTLTPYQKNPDFSRLYFTYRDASNELQTCEGPVIRSKEWTDCFIDAGDDIIRVGAGDQVLAYPVRAPICRKVRCNIGALRREHGFYGYFSGIIRYLKITDPKERKAYASWDFRTPAAPNRPRSVFLDTSDFGSDLQIIGAVHLSPAMIEEWKKNGWYE